MAVRAAPEPAIGLTGPMDTPRFRACLNADAAALMAQSGLPGDRAVPSCPDWSVDDLARHVAMVYRHKVEAIRTGTEPEEWPPAGMDAGDPWVALAAAYEDLCGEFDIHDPSDPAGTWYAPDQTVGFWIRRMAHETVIHRVDAELAAGQGVSPIPQDLALDGIDEVLRVFVAYCVDRWGEYFEPILADQPPWRTLITAGATSWLVTTRPGAVDVVGIDGRNIDDGRNIEAGRNIEVDLAIRGPEADVLRWLWNRGDDGVTASIEITGSPEAHAVLRACITTATQ